MTTAYLWVLVGCAALSGCASPPLSWQEMTVTEERFSVDSPLWNPRSLVAVDGVIYVSDVRFSDGSVNLSLARVEGRNIDPIAEYAWKPAGQPKHLYSPPPVPGWGRDLFVLVSSDLRDDKILRIAQSGHVDEFWHGPVGIVEQLIFVEGQEGLALVDQDHVVVLGQDGSESILYEGEGMASPSVFGQKIVVFSDHRILQLPEGRKIGAGWRGLRRDILRTMSSTDDRLYVVSTDKFREGQNLEQAKGSDGTIVWNKWRIPVASWYLQRTGSRCLLWDLDDQWFFVLGGDETLRLMWELPVESNAWVCPSNRSDPVIVAYDGGYSILHLEGSASDEPTP